MNLYWTTMIRGIRGLRENIKDPLNRNPLYLTLSRFIDSGSGFLFWILAARQYSVSDVGIATALISSLGLIMVFSRIGFDNTLIRFMPNNDHSTVISTSIWTTTIAAFVMGIAYLLAIEFISPEIAFIKDYGPLFLVFVIFNSITAITGIAFLASRKSHLQLIQSLIMGGRVLLLIPLAFFGSLGILYSVGITYIIATSFALAMVHRYFALTLKIDWEFTRKTFRFSSLNYLASMLYNIPMLVMPIFIVTLVGASDAALYYIAFAIGNLVLIIPDAMGTSLFVEGSHGMNLRSAVKRTLLINYSILIPAVLFVFFFGDMLLNFFGEGYRSAFDLLRIIVASSLFVTLYNLFTPIQNIRLRVRGIVVINLFRFTLLLVLSYVFLYYFGIIGAGYAWMITYIILGTAFIIFARRNKWI